MKLELPPLLKKIAATSNCPIFVVGGYIRNSLLGLEKSDIDICGSLLPDELGVDASVVPVNKRLGTALITDGVESYEYTPFRNESYGDGGNHIPKAVTFNATLIEDARRRDFTAGAVYYNTKTDEFVDPYGGLDDIERKVLRCADPDFTFADDGLRLMRLARIAAETGFTIDEATFAAARRNREKLKDISPERKRQELDKILNADLKYGVGDAHYRGVELLKELGLWEFVIKEIADMDGVKQNPLYHKYDCLEHTLMAVRYAPPKVRLAALVHDIAKPVCLSRDGNTYLHHEVGAELVKKVLGQEGLKYPLATINRVSSLVRLHMYDMSGKTKTGKVKLFVAKNFELIPDLVALIKADGRATGMKEIPPLHRFEIVYEDIKATHVPTSLSALNIRGEEVVAAGFSGNQVALVLDELWRMCILNPELNDRATLKEKITWLKRKMKV